MTRGFMFFLVVFAIGVLSSVACATQGNMAVARPLIWVSMIFGALAIVCEVAVSIEKWKNRRNRPHCLA